MDVTEAMNMICRSTSVTCKHISLPFPSPVLKELRIKGDGPGNEIDPANHLISISHYDAVNYLKSNPRPDG